MQTDHQLYDTLFVPINSQTTSRFLFVEILWFPGRNGWSDRLDEEPHKPARKEKKHKTRASACWCENMIKYRSCLLNETLDLKFIDSPEEPKTATRSSSTKRRRRMLSRSGNGRYGRRCYIKAGAEKGDQLVRRNTAHSAHPTATFNVIMHMHFVLLFRRSAYTLRFSFHLHESLKRQQ